MKSMPASSAICARRLQSGQLPDQRSGTMVTARPDEQLAPNRPICSLLSEYMARRDCREAACTGGPLGTDGCVLSTDPAACHHPRKRMIQYSMTPVGDYWVPRFRGA